MVVASAILMVGIVSVVQLVPASVQSSSRNRYDTMATVIAQRELDQILAQPLYASTFTDSTIIEISVPSGSVPDGYIKPDYQDPNDPNFQHGAAIFEIRWAVITRVNNGTITSKRFIIGCRQTNSTQPVVPVTLDTSLQR